jgi:hypothetical protein
MPRYSANLREAQALASRLDRGGDKLSAEIIRALIRSFEASRTTNQILHRDNLQLRACNAPDVQSNGTGAAA